MIIENHIPYNFHNENTLNQLIDLYPEPVVISNADGVLAYNHVAEKLVGIDITGLDITTFISGEPSKAMSRLRTDLMVKNKIHSTTNSYKINLPNGQLFDAEVITGYVVFDDQPALFSVIRDISKKKGALTEAARLQQELMDKQEPTLAGLDFDVIYKPSQTISGDFYFHHHLSDKKLIGILGDVSGKGIPAAMNISAFEIMFRTTIAQTSHPHEIVRQLNQMAFDFFKGRYIAVLCYYIDMESRTLQLASAGISEFIISNQYGDFVTHRLKGPFLGMFDNLAFDYLELDLLQGDRLYFYTDGMDFILDNETLYHNLTHNTDLESIRDELRQEITLKEIQEKQLYDDCTIISFEVKE